MLAELRGILHLLQFLLLIVVKDVGFGFDHNILDLLALLFYHFNAVFQSFEVVDSALQEILRIFNKVSDCHELLFSGHF